MSTRRRLRFDHQVVGLRPRPPSRPPPPPPSPLPGRGSQSVSQEGPSWGVITPPSPSRSMQNPFPRFVTTSRSRPHSLASTPLAASASASASSPPGLPGPGTALQNYVGIVLGAPMLGMARGAPYLHPPPGPPQLHGTEAGGMLLDQVPLPGHSSPQRYGSGAARYPAHVPECPSPGGGGGGRGGGWIAHVHVRDGAWIVQPAQGRVRFGLPDEVGTDVGHIPPPRGGTVPGNVPRARPLPLLLPRSSSGQGEGGRTAERCGWVGTGGDKGGGEGSPWDGDAADRGQGEGESDRCGHIGGGGVKYNK